ncbi:MAG TPA: SRPBCC domain-containing protein [bacterium]|nr:SRPBCC domain-containing protein [bacterium]
MLSKSKKSNKARNSSQSVKAVKPPKPLGKTLRQVVQFDAPPMSIYDLLMVSKLHAAFTGHKAVVPPMVDGLVSVYDGYIEARNVLLIPGKRIVQAWRGRDWPEGWYSTATWEFDATPRGTRMTFIQDNIPAAELEHMRTGWMEHYWDRMKAYLAKQAR